ncbi:7125_t:CDS:2 [Entrophospora sp. SA101]|nr:7125_t:CDS:2 [Entrophospora sp. SA101]
MNTTYIADDNISNNSITNNNDSIKAIKKNTFSPPQTPKTPNFLNPSEHHPLSLITMASKMPQTAIISSLLHQQLYHSPIEDLHHQQFSLQMSRADNSIDLDNGQSSLVINQPDHLQQQLMFTQDEFQQFPSELSQDDWNSQLFNYINGSNANNDGYYVQNFMNLFAAANPFPLDFSQLNDYN